MSEFSSTFHDDYHRHLTDTAEVSFENFKEDRDGTLRAEITVATSLLDAGTIAGPERLNLLSGRSITSLAKQCTERVDLEDWYAIISGACAASVKHWRDGDPLLPVDIDADHRRQWLLDPFLESSGFTVLFARGGSGKSFLAGAIALSIATDTPIFGEVTTPGPVAYLDWEASKEEFDSRVGRLARALDIHRPQVWYRREQTSLASSYKSLAKSFRHHGVVAAVVDSKGMAAAGSPESTETALELFRAIRRLGVPVLLIDHVSKGAIKGDDPDMAFGSAYTEYQARLAWKVTSEWHPGEIVMNCRNTKANNGPKRPQQSIRFTFDDDRVLISANGARAGARAPDPLPDPMEV